MGTETAILAARLRQKNSGRPAKYGSKIYWLSPAALVSTALLLLIGCSELPRVEDETSLSASIWGAASLLCITFLFLRRRVRLAGRTLTCQLVPRKVHYVQLIMHSCIYAYWGYYWREVYRFAPLILAQIVLAYAFDMLLCWYRRDRWILGFGPIPIVLSTNLFLWFKDDWFFLQFLMIGAALVGKEFVTWNRGGRRAHIFNPSAFALSLFSICLLVTGSTGITRGEEIAFTFAYPPHIYFAIFLVGLVVQALFSVTLVTLAAVGALFGLNAAYLGLTGSTLFVDSNLPVLVFLGCHLLITDPATSPRSNTGRILFGGLYGAGVFSLRALLGWLGVPVFYDKLLCVPALNLGAPALDSLGVALAGRFRRFESVPILRSARANLAHMTLWVVLFTTMTSSGFLVEVRGAGNPEDLRRGCIDREGNACVEWIRSLNLHCAAGYGPACMILGDVLHDGIVVPPDRLNANRDFRRACGLGIRKGCLAEKEKAE